MNDVIDARVKDGKDCLSSLPFVWNGEIRWKVGGWKNCEKRINVVRASLDSLTPPFPSRRFSRDRGWWGNAQKIYRLKMGDSELVFSDLNVRIPDWIISLKSFMLWDKC